MLLAIPSVATSFKGFPRKYKAMSLLIDSQKSFSKAWWRDAFSDVFWAQAPCRIMTASISRFLERRNCTIGCFFRSHINFAGPTPIWKNMPWQFCMQARKSRWELIRGIEERCGSNQSWIMILWQELCFGWSKDPEQIQTTCFLKHHHNKENRRRWPETVVRTSLFSQREQGVRQQRKQKKMMWISKLITQITITFTWGDRVYIWHAMSPCLKQETHTRWSKSMLPLTMFLVIQVWGGQCMSMWVTIDPTIALHAFCLWVTNGTSNETVKECTAQKGSRWAPRLER